VASRAKRGKVGDAPAGSRAGKGRKLDLRRKSCFFCKAKVAEIDYKSIGQLRRFISDRGKIRGRGQTGTCRRHQRQVAVAIKRAREMALLPYVGEAQEPRLGPRSRRAEQSTRDGS